MMQIHAALGPPGVDERTWLATLPGYDVVVFDTRPDACLSDTLPDAPPDAMRLLRRILKYVPTARATADEALSDICLLNAQGMPRDELERLLLKVLD